MKVIKLCIALSLAFCVGCTDASCSRTFSVNNEHAVRLYSGGKCVEKWTSTGYVERTDGGNVFFTDKQTGRLVMTTGDVVVEQVD
jgi:hypothetical protein